MYIPAEAVWLHLSVYGGGGVGDVNHPLLLSTAVHCWAVPIPANADRTSAALLASDVSFMLERCHLCPSLPISTCLAPLAASDASASH